MPDIFARRRVLFNRSLDLLVIKLGKPFVPTEVVDRLEFCDLLASEFVSTAADISR